MKNWRLVLGGVAIAMSSFLTVTMGDAAATPQVTVAETSVAVQTAPWLTRECEYEDSVNCYWDATTMGDGAGNSFSVIRRKDKAQHEIVVCILFWDREYAKKNDRCWTQRKGVDMIAKMKEQG